MIREMTEADLPEVLEIEKADFYTPWNQQQCLYELKENPYAKLFVAVNDENEVIGYYDLWVIFEQAEIAKIAVKPNCQHQGLGKAMMADLEQKAMAEGCETISLEVRSTNENAIALYEKSGFIQINTKKDYYKTENGYEDAFFMMKGI